MMSQQVDRLPLVDVLRGYALICIMLDHNHMSALSSATLARFSFFDAAELFVLLAGFLVGLLWEKLEASQGPAAARRRFLKRTGELYQSYFVTALLVSALAALLMVFGLKQGVVWPGFGERLVETPHEFIAKTASFWSPPNLADILTIYVVLLATTPLAMPLLRRRPFLFAAISLVLWAFAQPLNGLIPTGREGGGLLFNPFGWQVVFFTGALLAAFRKSIASFLRPYSTVITAAAAMVALAGVFYAVGRDWPAVGATAAWEGLRAQLGEIDKWNVDEVRFIGLLAMVWLVSLIGRETASSIAATRPGLALSAIGRQGLACFVLGVALSVLGDAAARVLEPGLGYWTAALLVDAVTIALMVAAAFALEQKRGARTVDWALTRIGRQAVETAMEAGAAPRPSARPVRAELSRAGGR